MAAELIVCGEHAVGVGGEFERECARTLRDQLPEGYVIATNVSVPRGAGEFYECDAVIAAPGICDILEMKCIRPEATVGEDRIVGTMDFTVDRVFSRLDHKAKVLASRRERAPFPMGAQHRSVRVHTQVVVPSDTRITFKIPDHVRSKPVRTLADTVDKYRALASSLDCFRDATTQRELRNGWIAYRDESCRGQRRTPRHLGRFAIRRQIRAPQPLFEYFAVDESPCEMEVLLREFPFDPAQPAPTLQEYLRSVARETRVLMKLRHPYIGCVVGHFQTGASWVQVSDWFDGDRLEDMWGAIQGASIWDKIGIFSKVVQALQFCHEKGVFHRNVGASSIRISRDLSEVRVVGFNCALDLAGTTTSNSVAIQTRDPRITPPEELHGGRSANLRLGDIFQTGVLLYRLLENGKWPFSDTFEYITSSGQLQPFSEQQNGSEVAFLRRMASEMMAVDPARRPDLLRKVEQAIADM